MSGYSEAGQGVGERGTGSGLSLKRLAPVLVLAAGLIAFIALGGLDYLSFDTLKEHRGTLQALVAENFLAVAVIFTLAYALATAFSLPGGLVLTVAGGFLFGTWIATCLVVIGATVGATAVFLAARYAFRDYFHARAGKWLTRMEAGFRENEFSYMLVLRLVPLFPFFLVNLVPALLGVSFRTYTLTTLIGIVPGTLVYASVGNGLGAIFDRGGMPDASIIFEPQILLPILGLSVLSLVPVAYKRWRGKKPAAEV